MSGLKVDVPDSIRPYLNEIAERLWAQRAAVMVGSGFSKNAGDSFPDWSQLGDLLYQKAHGCKPDPAKQKYLNVLRLAEEVQAAIGRPALENLVRSNIPDLNIEPSGLHVELLEFPWVDVFTTNYDTLLERASAKVVTRRYEPVVNKEDIPYAIKPRIVKLHGSFPSERPFIVTEEDYRRYPHDYAPFVNTVQQVLLENTFCLIGFSGDDPNFLQWTGWIRDNLGRDKAQKIYLVGVFDLSSARLKLLAERGIIVVDLSCCEDVEKHDHKKALYRFFEYIRSRKPDALDWPYNPETMYPERSEDRIEEIQKVTVEWRAQRLRYPGWLILPYSNRGKLWAHTDAWVNFLPDMEKSPPGTDIQYAFELIWRLERCLLPVFDNIAAFCEKLLEKYWPFQGERLPDNCQIHPGEKQFHNLPWKDLQSAWLAIAVAMLRFYREEGYIEKWKGLKSRIKTVSDYLSADQNEFLKYEAFLFSVFTLDFPSAKRRIQSWNPSAAQPYWLAKRAAALAEIGLLGEAEAIIKHALENIRNKLDQKIGAEDLTLVSLEANAMLLAKYIQDAVALGKGELEKLQEKRTQFNDRWNDLKGFKCDPWNEIELFELTLKGPATQIKTVSEKREFDIGRITKTRNLSTADKEALNAYAFLRFCEEVGFPYKVGGYTMGKKAALASLQRISRYSSFWAIATLHRIGDVKAVDSLFSRESVYRFTVSEADQLVSGYLDALNESREEIRAGDAFQNDNFGVRLAQFLPEVISRLCCKCSMEVKNRILNFVTGIYASPEKPKYRSINHLLSRLIRSMSEVEQYKLVPDLLKIRFPEDLTLIIEKEFLNPFLLLEVNQKPERAPSINVQPELVDDLLRNAVLDNSNRRHWAVTSLVKLHDLLLLDERQSQKLAEAIWQVTDKYGLPDDTGFYKFVFLKLPHPEGVEPVERFKDYVKSVPFPIQKRKRDNGVSMTGGHIPIVDEIIGSNGKGMNIWTAEDIAQILERLLEWWDADKDWLNKKEDGLEGFASISEEFRARFLRMIDLLAEVVCPKLSYELSSEIRKSCNRLIEEVRSNGLPSLEAEAATLQAYPDRKAEVYSRINEALVSSKGEEQRDGLKAISRIIFNDRNLSESTIEPSPTLMLREYLTWCPTHSIVSALWLIVRILKNLPTAFSRDLEAATLRRLGRLLVDTKYERDASELNFDEKLEVRRVSSILASEIWEYYKSRHLGVPAVVEEWRLECLSQNEFSEIRNPWKDK